MQESEEERKKRMQFWEEYRQEIEERRKKLCKGKKRLRKRGAKIYGVNKK